MKIKRKQKSHRMGGLGCSSAICEVSGFDRRVKATNGLGAILESLLSVRLEAYITGAVSLYSLTLTYSKGEVNALHH